MVSSGYDAAWLVNPQARDRLQALDVALMTLAGAKAAEMHAVSTYLLRRGGKRIRPALLFVAAALGNGHEEAETTAAAGIELVHVASLYHDDVMDQAIRRRGVESVNQHWDNLTAVLGGTYLFSRAIEAIATLPPEVRQVTGRAWATVCAGQIHETENAYGLDLPVAEHLAVLAKKTATLFELPCRVGGLLGGLPDEQVEALATYGSELGVAFQLADDALDIKGDPAALGKHPGTDLRRGVYSLPVLSTLGNGNPDGQRAAALLSLMEPTDEDLDEVLDLVRRGNGVTQTLQHAQSMAVTAVRRLKQLPDSTARRSLTNLADFVVERSM